MKPCARCGADPDEAPESRLCGDCDKMLISQLIKQATIKLALTVAGLVCITVVFIFTVLMLGKSSGGSVVFKNKQGGTLDIPTPAFLAIACLLFAGSALILFIADRAGRKVKQLESDYASLAGKPPVYSIADQSTPELK